MSSSQRVFVVDGKKHCPGCNTTKQISEFNRKSNSACGYASHCKSCQRAWRKNTPAGLAYKRASKERWRKRNLEKARASTEVFRAIERGDIKRQPCVKCGNKNTHGHHYLGYDKSHWYDVMWLCPKHHREEHDA